MSNDKVRAAFESWYSGVTLNTVWFERDTKNPDEYSWQDTHIAWLAWRAALALPVEPKVELVAWRDAIIDALVIAHIYRAEHDDDPRKALHDLLAWEVSVALDPLVSADARALRDAPPAKVEPMAGSPDSNCPCKSENEDLHGQSASAGDEVEKVLVDLRLISADADDCATDWDRWTAARAAALIERLAARLLENEEACRASDQKEFPATYRAWEKKWVAQGAELADMTKERDKAVRMFKAAVTGQDSQDRWLPCIEHRFKVDYRASGCPQCQIEKAIAQAEASAKDAARWKWTEMEARRAGVDMDNARTEIDAAIAKGAP